MKSTQMLQPGDEADDLLESSSELLLPENNSTNRQNYTMSCIVICSL